jgi:hypothetical protein
VLLSADTESRLAMGFSKTQRVHPAYVSNVRRMPNADYSSATCRLNALEGELSFPRLGDL